VHSFWPLQAQAATSQIIPLEQSASRVHVEGGLKHVPHPSGIPGARHSGQPGWHSLSVRQHSAS
jgi:hypothetical protein